MDHVKKKWGKDFYVHEKKAMSRIFGAHSLILNVLQETSQQFFYVDGRPATERTDVSVEKGGGNLIFSSSSSSSSFTYPPSVVDCWVGLFLLLNSSSSLPSLPTPPHPQEARMLKERNAKNRDQKQQQQQQQQQQQLQPHRPLGPTMSLKAVVGEKS